MSASDDRTLKLWDLASGRELLTFEGHTGWVRAVTLTPDGTRAVSGSADRIVAVWDLVTRNLVATFGADSAILACAVAADGVTIVAGDAQGHVHFLRLENAS